MRADEKKEIQTVVLVWAVALVLSVPVIWLIF